MRLFVMIFFAFIASYVMTANALDIDGSEKDCSKLTQYIAQTDYLKYQGFYTKSIENYNKLIALAEVCLTRQDPIISNWFKLSDGKKLNTLYNKIAITYLSVNQPYKAKLYLMLADAQDSTTKKNKKLVNNRLLRLKTKNSLEGIYWQYSGFGVWNTIHITPTPDKSWKLQVNLFHVTNPFIGAIDSAEISSLLFSQYDQLTYISDNDELSCEIGFRLDKNKIMVNTSPFNNQCGFERNIYAKGIYQRVANK